MSLWLSDLPLLEWFQVILMIDNAPSRVSKTTTSFLASLGINRVTFMTWSPCSLDLNPNEQLWSILKREFYEESQQFTSKDAIWNKRFDFASAITPSQINRLFSYADSRLLRVTSRNESYIDKYLLNSSLHVIYIVTYNLVYWIKES